MTFRQVRYNAWESECGSWRIVRTPEYFFRLYNLDAFQCVGTYQSKAQAENVARQATWLMAQLVRYQKN
jgi:hypothetical protein